MKLRHSKFDGENPLQLTPAHQGPLEGDIFIFIFIAYLVRRYDRSSTKFIRRRPATKSICLNFYVLVFGFLSCCPSAPHTRTDRGLWIGIGGVGDTVRVEDKVRVGIMALEGRIDLIT